MDKFAIIENGAVENLAVADEPLAENWVRLQPGQFASIGYLWDGEEFTPPPALAAPVPQSVTMRQARLALLGAGLLDNVDAAMAAIPDETMRRAAQIEWEYAATVDRTSALVSNLSGALGLTDAQLDALFIAAGAL